MPLLITGVASLDEVEVVDVEDDETGLDFGGVLLLSVVLLLLLGLRLMTLEGVLLAFFLSLLVSYGLKEKGR